MYRLLLSFTAMAAAAAAAEPPQIAYAVAGAKGDAIYLIDPDATRQIKIYQGRANSRSGAPIDDIAIRLRAEDPNGGGEVAFIENLREVKVQRHLANGQPDGAAYRISINSPSCIFGDLDYLADGTLVIADSCLNVWTVSPGAAESEPTPLFRGNVGSLTGVGNDLMYVQDGELTRRTSSGTVTSIATLNFPYFYVDVAGSVAHLSDKQTYQTVNLDTGAVNPGCTSAGMVEVSPSGSQILYLFRGWAFIHSATCSGAPFRLVKGVRSMAWRTY